MGNTYDRVAHRYFGRLVGDTTRPNLRSDRMPIVRMNGEEVICSYGSHFPLAMPVRNKKGKATGLVLNGDRSTMTTMTRHMPVIRTAAAGTGLPTVTIPFSALTQAGIDPASVQILEVTRDRFETIPIVTYDFPDGAVWGEVEVTDVSGTWMALDGDGNPWVNRFPTARAYPSGPLGLHWRLLSTLLREDEKRRGHHWGYYGQVTHRESRLFTNAKKWDEWTVERQPDGRTKYSRTIHRHWLGESLISGEVVWVEHKRCKTCGGRGRGPYTTSGGRCPTCDWQGGVLRITKRRRTKFLSGFDANETRPSYFFCELPPKCAATTIEEAYDALKPDAVRLAEQMGREVRRQGDLFAVATAFDKRSLRKMGAAFGKAAFVHNTNHRVTEVATLPNGVTLGRGTMTHDPGRWRRPDHKRLSLGKNWFAIVKNEVPVVARTDR